MADNSSGRKKTLIISLLAFLLVGGGVFLFFIIQGSNDLTRSKNSNFHYSSVVRGSMAPFFRYLGLDSGEKEAPKTINDARVQAYLDKSSAIDMSDWMDSGAGGGGGSPDGGRRASARAPAVIPRMEGGGMGGLSEGGGGTQSSGGGSRFEGGPDRANARVSGAAPSGGGGARAGRGGTLGSLRGAQALLSSGLRSGSAMTAKSKWDNSFGAGTTSRGGSGGGGNMAYGKDGLVGLDTIKSGDISDLKTTNPEGVNAPAASMPGLSDPEKKEDMAAALGKELAGSLINKAVGKGSSFMGGTNNAPNSRGEVKDPPPEVKAAGEKPWSDPDGYYCKTPCAIDDDGYKFLAKDNEIVYKQDGENWTVTYKGEYALGETPPGTPYGTYTQTFNVEKGKDGSVVLSQQNGGAGVCTRLDGSVCPDLSVPGAVP